MRRRTNRAVIFSVPIRIAVLVKRYCQWTIGVGRRACPRSSTVGYSYCEYYYPCRIGTPRAGRLYRVSHKTKNSSGSMSAVPLRRCFLLCFQKAPSFGFPNEERIFCSAHKRPGMEYLAGAGEHHRGGAGDALTQVTTHTF